MHPQQGGGFSEHQSQSGALQPCRKTFLYSFKAQNILKISFPLKKNTPLICSENKKHNDFWSAMIRR